MEKRKYLAPLLLIAMQSCGSSSSEDDAESVGNEPPVAEFSTTPSSGRAPLEVVFDASASTDDVEIVSYAWTLDEALLLEDGVVSSHFFEVSGSYTIELTVTDNQGATSTAQQVISVEPGNRLSGSVVVPGASRIDGDTNNPDNPHFENNSFDTAQHLENNVLLGGYAATPGSGAQGVLQEIGDVSDFYAMPLSAGQLVQLSIAAAADLDLRIWDTNQVLIDASVSNSTQEQVSIEADGEYIVEVVAINGASNYILTTSLGLPDTQARTLWLPYAADEFLVRGDVGASLTNGMRVERRGGAVEHVFTNGADPWYEMLMRTALPTHGTVGDHALRRYRQLLGLKAIQDWRGVDAAEPVFLRASMAVSNDPLFESQWHYDSINIPSAWDTSQGSGDVSVAVIDTGVLLAHPDLEGQLLPGFDFISDPDNALDGDGVDNNPDDPGDGGAFFSSSFHGTHVAGIAAAGDNGIGGTGVAPGSRIMPLRVLGRNGGTSADLIEALRYAGGLTNISGEVPSQPVSIVNMSLGGGGYSQFEQDTITELVSQNILIVASAGNEGSTQPMYPAAYDGVVSVAATNIAGTLTQYTNFGTTVDIAAPGGSTDSDVNADGLADGILSTLGDDSSGNIEFGWGILTGTSMSAPHVSGVLALMKSLYPSLSPSDIENLLLRGDLSLPIDGESLSVVDADRAVTAAQRLASGELLSSVVVSSPDVLQFTEFDDELILTLSVVGETPLAVRDMSTNATWLDVIARDVDTNGIGSYYVRVDRTNLADGMSFADIVVETSENTLTVSVALETLSDRSGATVGTQYIVLADPVTNRTVRSLVLNDAASGVYVFEFTDLAPGDYLVVVGTDNDNDGLICDAGDACGGYPELDDLAIVTIADDSEIVALEIISSYQSLIDTSRSTHHRIESGLAY